METNQANGVDLLKTVGACFLAPIVWLIGAMLGGGIYAIVNSIFTVIRPGIIQFFAVIIGTWVGMYAARVACDSWLKGYHAQTVFFIFAVLCIGAGYFEFIVLPLDLSRFSSYAQVIMMGISSYMLFWKYEPIA